MTLKKKKDKICKFKKRKLEKKKTATTSAIPTEFESLNGGTQRRTVVLYS